MKTRGAWLTGLRSSADRSRRNRSAKILREGEPKRVTKMIKTVDANL